MTELLVDAPIVAVAVYPDRARITRRGKVIVPAGDQTVYVEPLPLVLEQDSVRVAGRGPATVLGVDLATRHNPQAPDETVAELERQRREAQAEVAELADDDDVQAQLDAFLTQLARRAGGSFARSLASGETATELSGFTESLAARLSAVRSKRRELATLRHEADDRLAAADRRRRRDRAATHNRPPFGRRRVGPEERGGGGDRAVVRRPVCRLDELVRRTPSRRTLTLSWYGLVSQQTGEDWPECALTLSTARPTATAKVPELDPWYLDRFHLPVPAAFR